MESKIVDARGMACPMPVIKTKKVLEAMAEGSVTTIVDNEAAKENVVTLAKGMGLEVEIRQEEGEYHLLIAKKKGSLPLAEANFAGSNAVFVQSSEFGHGSTELGNILMKSFMFTLVESDTPPQCLLFVNSYFLSTCYNKYISVFKSFFLPSLSQPIISRKASIRTFNCSVSDSE